jgi:ATP-dependent protease HslVU (ClpYQ) peptidase subunit
MTVIVGIETEEGTFIGGDSLGSNGCTGNAFERPKVFTKGDFVIGVYGCYRLMQLLEFKLNIPPRKENQTVDSYIYVDFIDAVRECVKHNGCLLNKTGVESLTGGFLFSYKGKLYSFEPNLFILIPKCKYIADGSGSSFATASLYSTADTELLPEQRIRKAIECAGNFVISVNNDPTVIFQKKN